MPLSNKNKNVPPLVIPKSRIQNVPNHSAENIQGNNSIDGWVTPTRPKRNQTSPNAPSNSNKLFITPNRFALFSDNQLVDNKPIPPVAVSDVPMDDALPVPKLPPPIFIRVVNDYKSFCENIKQLTNGEPFLCKSTSNGIKLSTNLPDSYRAVIKFLQTNKAAFHTYQLKQDRAFRVVIRNLHHSTPISEIKNELAALGHTARNITNVLQRTTKIPLPLFFVDLEPDINNKDVFNINQLYYTKIKVEEPRINTQPIQCLRCQGFGHTKSYCNHPPKCVRCGDSHTSDYCQKPANLPPKCALCSGDHPANYRGCSAFKKIQAAHHQRKTNSNQDNSNQVYPNVKSNVNTTFNMNTQPKSYSQATSGPPSQTYPQTTTQNPDHLAQQMALFLNNFQATINPLISLLTTLIEKLMLSNNGK